MKTFGWFFVLLAAISLIGALINRVYHPLIIVSISLIAAWMCFESENDVDDGTV